MQSTLKIDTYSFDANGKNALSVAEPKSKNWPVVYLINNDRELYIGETQNAVARMQQHLENPARNGLNNFNIIVDDEFNKSAILDIEQSLIQLCGADHKYKLQNMNGGQSFKHDYYQREKYLNKLDDIWLRLKNMNLVNRDISDIRNDNLFKYSPYNSLTAEQANVCNDIIKDATSKLMNDQEGTAVINGGAGTGKTIVLINLLYRLVSAGNININQSEDDEDLSEYMNIVMAIQNLLAACNGRELKIAYVCPMTSLRATMKKVFQQTGNGLKGKMVVGPYEVFDGGDKFDIVLVDEAHRLSQRKNLANYGDFDRHARDIGMDPNEATQLDMIVARSKYRILVYDANQTVKGADLTNEQFERAIGGGPVRRYRLQTQMRCAGGEQFTDYIDEIFACRQAEMLEFDPVKYDFKIFDDVDRMVNAIKAKDEAIGLCRCAAGYAWKWVSKRHISKGFDYINGNHLQDIHIQGHDYVWNMTNEEFILSPGAVNQIGCIHTLQGYDLNYVGLIFGEEIDYDPNTNQIIVDRNRFYDSKVKSGVSDDVLKRYIINSYKVMMTRGIKGCYVYVCNDNLREYLRRFIEE